GCGEAGMVAVELSRVKNGGEPVAPVAGPVGDGPGGKLDGFPGVRRCPGNAFDLDAPVLEQLVEHPPGERAMRAAALQRKIDRFCRSLSRSPGCKQPARRRARHREKIRKQNRNHLQPWVGGLDSGGIDGYGKRIAALQYQLWRRSKSETPAKGVRWPAC